MEVIKWTGIGLGSFITLVFGLVIRKVDKKDFDKHCERQAKVNDKFDETIKKNNDILIRVETQLNERTK